MVTIHSPVYTEATVAQNLPQIVGKEPFDVSVLNAKRSVERPTENHGAQSDRIRNIIARHIRMLGIRETAPEFQPSAILVTMTSPLIYGFVAALGYGIGDYISRIAGRAIGVWRSLFYANLFALILLSAGLLLFSRVPPAPLAGSAASYAAAIGAGIVLFAAAAFLTRGLIIGNIAVVVPVTASYGAITAILSIIAGERLSATVEIGLAVTAICVCLVSIPSRRSEYREHFRTSGIGWAVGAAVCYGLGLWLQGSFAVPVLGSFVPVWLSYASSLVVMAFMGRFLRVRLTMPNSQSVASVLATGALSVFAYVVLAMGLSTGSISIVVVLSTLSSAVTMLVARFLGNAPIAAHQWVAVGGIIAGLCLIRS